MKVTLFSLSVLIVGSLAAVAAMAGPVVPPQFVLQQPVTAHSAPPSGPLNVIVGRRVQTLPAGQTVKVVDTQTYGDFGGQHVWLKVQPLRSPGSSMPEAPMWIYGGRTTDKQPVPPVASGQR